MMDEFDDIPDALRRDLKAASPRAEIPADVDAAIRARARHELKHARTRSPWWARGIAGIAAGLAIVLTLLAIWRGDFGGKRPASLADDVNRDGRVDIVDALVLARAVEVSGGPVRAPWDRAVWLKREDADRIAQLVVGLPKDRAEGAQELGGPTAMITACDLGSAEDRP